MGQPEGLNGSLVALRSPKFFATQKTSLKPDVKRNKKNRLRYRRGFELH
jgi:hypothetical protein